MVAQARSQRRSTSAIDEEAIARQALASLRAAGNEAAANAIAEALRSPDSTVIAASGQSQTIIRSADSADSEGSANEDDAPMSATEEPGLAESVRLLQEQMAEVNRNQQEQLRQTEERLERSHQETEEARSQIAQLREQLTQSQAATDEARQRVEELEPLQRLTELQGRTRFDTDGTGTRSTASPYSDRNFNTIVNPARNSPHGFAEDLMAARLSSRQLLKNPQNGHCGYAYDPSDVNKLIRQANRARERGSADPFVDLETYFKRNGLLSGSEAKTTAILAEAGPTIGTEGSIGAFFLDTISAILRLNNRKGGIFWQFTFNAYQPGVAIGQLHLLPRVHFLPRPKNTQNYKLASTNTYRAIPPASGTSSDSQAMTASTVGIESCEWGIGSGLEEGAFPLFIPEFHAATNLFGAIDVLANSLLWNHYLEWEEEWIREQYEKSEAIFYNKKNRLQSTAGNIETGDDATMTLAFLRAAYAHKLSNGEPNFPQTGRYIAAMPPIAVLQLQEDLDTRYRPPTPDQMQFISDVLRPISKSEIERVSNYIGSYGGFDIFEGATFGAGEPNSSPTSLMTPFGAGSVHTVDTFTISPGAVGQGTSMPFEIRPANWNQYGRGDSLVWMMCGGIAPIDLDPGRSEARDGELSRCQRLRTAVHKV